VGLFGKSTDWLNNRKGRVFSNAVVCSAAFRRGNEAGLADLVADFVLQNSEAAE
jgi:hypothetical protein